MQVSQNKTYKDSAKGMKQTELLEKSRKVCLSSSPNSPDKFIPPCNKRQDKFTR